MEWTGSPQSKAERRLEFKSASYKKRTRTKAELNLGALEKAVESAIANHIKMIVKNAVVRTIEQ